MAAGGGVAGVHAENLAANGASGIDAAAVYRRNFEARILSANINSEIRNMTAAITMRHRIRCANLLVGAHPHYRSKRCATGFLFMGCTGVFADENKWTYCIRVPVLCSCLQLQWPVFRLSCCSISSREEFVILTSTERNIW